MPNIWDEGFLAILNQLGVPSHMIRRATTGMNSRWDPIYRLFTQQSIPVEGWKDDQISFLLMLLNSLDSDKDPEAIRIGEREARISTSLLKDLSGGFCHGVGRSGELTAPQPKAAGASIMQNLANKLVLSLVKNLGLSNVKGALTTPFGTGMSLGMALRGLYNFYKLDIHEKPNVLYCQADHKSPLKGIKFIGANPITVPGHYGKNHFAQEGVYVSPEEIEEYMVKYSGKLGAVVSTTTFFAPRVPDDIKKIAKLAQKHNLIHIINNAYGIQVPEVLASVRSAIDAGRVDAIIHSTDKNLLTPVGGGIILAPQKEIIESISKTFAGRASASPVLHLFVSLLSLGLNGYKAEIEQQKENRIILEKQMYKLALKMGEEIIKCDNPVSVAMSLKTLSPEHISDLGGYLYNLRITGPRVLDSESKPFGTCTSEIPYPYVVMNAAIGSNQNHILESVIRLEKGIYQLK